MNCGQEMRGNSCLPPSRNMILKRFAIFGKALWDEIKGPFQFLKQCRIFLRQFDFNNKLFRTVATVGKVWSKIRGLI